MPKCFQCDVHRLKKRHQYYYARATSKRLRIVPVDAARAVGFVFASLHRGGGSLKKLGRWGAHLNGGLT